LEHSFGKRLERPQKTKSKSLSLEAEPVALLASMIDKSIARFDQPLLNEVGSPFSQRKSGPRCLDLRRYAQRDIGVVVLDYSMLDLNGENPWTSSAG